MNELLTASSIAVTAALFLGGAYALYSSQRRKQQRSGGLEADPNARRQAFVILAIILASVAISAAATALL